MPYFDKTTLIKQSSYRLYKFLILIKNAIPLFAVVEMNAPSV